MKGTPNMKTVVYGTVLLLIFVWIQIAAGADIGLGSTRDEVLSALGKPKGVMTIGQREALTYDGGVLEIEQNRVVYIEPQFKEKSLRASNQRKFEADQKAKGLVFYDDRWMKPEEQARLEEKKRKLQEAIQAKQLEKDRADAAKFERLKSATRIHNDEGRELDLNSLIEPGKITLIDFYAEWCGPCKRLAPYLASLVANNDGLVLHKIDIVDWNSPLARQYQINSIPSVRVYDRKGQLVGKPTGDFNKIAEYVSSVF